MTALLQGEGWDEIRQLAQRQADSESSRNSSDTVTVLCYKSEATMDFRPFFVKLRKDLDPKEEMKQDMRDRGFASFYPHAFQKKRLYPVLAVDTDKAALNGTTKDCVQRRPMLLLPDDDGFIVWVEGRYFHFAGFKDKKS